MNISSAFRTNIAQRSLQHLRSTRGWMGGVVALVLAANAPAQQVVMPALEVPLVAPIMRSTNPGEVTSSTSFQNFPTNAPITVGEFKLRPHLMTSLLHADGLPSQSGARVTSNIFTFAPGLQADLGTHWTLDYTPTWRNYSASDLRNAVDHDFRVVGANRAPDLTLELTESYTVTSPILIETAQQTKQKTWSNALSASHNFGNLLRYQGTVSMTDSKSENFANIRDWATMHWMRATVSPKLDTGIGFGAGYSDIVARPNTHYEQYLGEVQWLATDRIKLAVQGGWQDRHSLSASVPDERNPILQATLGWRPFDQTAISLTDTRTVSNTLGGDGTNVSNGWGVSLNQRLLSILYLNLAYNHQASNYRANSNQLANRSDVVKSFSSALSVQLFKYWSLAATYQTSKNDTNQTVFRLSSTQYGIALTGRL